MGSDSRRRRRVQRRAASSPRRGIPQARRRRSPGIGRLLRLVREHGQALEADLLRYYGVDLGAVLTGELSVRRLASLVHGLPAESATVRAELGAEAFWGLGEHLQARMLDVLAAANWQRGGGKGPRPKPIPRPGAAAANHYGRSSADPAAVVAFLATLKPLPAEDVTEVSDGS